MPEERLEKEWFDQAKYDFGSAEGLHKIGQHIHAVFMCHLSIEKALKGVYAMKYEKDPPKTHSLSYLIDAIGDDMPSNIREFVVALSAASVTTRYPDQLHEMKKEYNKKKTADILTKSKEALKWLKVKL